MKRERWKAITGFPSYEVSDLGRVRSLDRAVLKGAYSHVRHGKILSPAIVHDQYQGIGLYKDGKHYTRKIHRLVATAFIPNPSNLPEVNHIKGKSNAASNLEWCNRQGNVEHAVKHGLIARGSKQGRARLNTKQVKEIKQSLKSRSGSITSLAEKYGVHPATIFAIKSGQSWKWIKAKDWRAL